MSAWPVDVDRLLIVTFTEAVASENERADRIGHRKTAGTSVRETPDWQQQAALIHTAPITTIHSFCLSVIRDHFHVIGIDPG